MDSILDNQEVTAGMLNDIAVDLGASSFNGFTENKFGADELNKITQALATKGILQTGNQCRAVKTGDRINIQDGIIVFGSGAKKRIETPVSVDLVNNSYIYAFNDTALNNISIIVSGTAPAAGDFVMLAETDGEGGLTDRRQFAMGKNAPKTGNFSVTKTISLSLYSSSPVQFEEMGFGGFSYILYRRYDTAKVCEDISDGGQHTIFLNSSAAGQCPKVQKTGTGLTFTMGGNRADGNYEITVI